MPITIFAGGCRHPLDTHKVKLKRCDACFVQDACILEPHAVDLSDLTASPWIKTSILRPPEKAALLYLEYLPAERCSVVHYGRYVGRERQFVEQESGATLAEGRVIAWALVSETTTAENERCGVRKLPSVRLAGKPHREQTSSN